MSTEQQNILPPHSGLISTNTIANSIRSEQRDRRLEPEDLRTRRFGYNPGFKMQMDPVWSGLQNALIEPGVAILFETGPVSRQSHSVDKDDRTPPNVIVDFLAGEGLRNVYMQNSGMGFRELLPLRGLSDDEAGNLFGIVHPTLADCVEHGIIPECIYGLTACITCRFNALKKMRSVPVAAAQLLTTVTESVTVGRANMAAQWRTAIGEVAGVAAGTNRRMALGNLTEDHLHFMRQLHERTPEDMELEKIARNAKGQADAMRESLKEQTQMLAQAMQSGSQNRDAAAQERELADLRERSRVMEEQLAKLLAAQGDRPKKPRSPTFR